MKNFSNTYIFLFAAGMVIIVASFLSFISESLKPYQARNVEIEKKQDILGSVRMSEGVATATDKNTYVEEQYAKFIRKSLVVNSKGEVVEGLDAFLVTDNLKEEMKKPPEGRNLPLFLFTDEQGEVKYIIPVRGKGLWGPIWGYVALDDDFNTIYGAVFDHKGETPGLGAEIREEWFEQEFQGKNLYDENGKFVSVEVVKGGTSDDNPYGVDAISGGTITSKGLQNMIFDNILPYDAFFKSQLRQ